MNVKTGKGAVLNIKREREREGLYTFSTFSEHHDFMTLLN